MARSSDRSASLPRLAPGGRMDRPLTPDSDATTDHDALERLRRLGGAKLRREMIALFLAAVPERLQAARDGIRQGDAAVTERALHSLKSSSGQLGAIKMQQLSERGEQLARTGSLKDV